MLSGGDVAAGKLLVQLGLVSVEDVRSHLRAVDQSREQGLDLVASLFDGGRIGVDDLKRVRRYQAMFEHVRLEAVYLRAVEQRQPPLESGAVSTILAKLERDPYRRRLAAVLAELGILDGSEARELERKVRRRIAKEDLRVLERYRSEDFSGVARPLIPVSAVKTDVFKVSNLFRSKATQRLVRSALARLAEAELAGGGAVEAATGMRELMPRGEVGSEEEDTSEERAALVQLQTGRFRPIESVATPESDLESRKEIGVYQVVECVGEGGMGAVYMAREEAHGPLVAVKVMLAARAAREDLARFEREIALLARVDHPGVVRLMDQGTTPDGLRFMVMPFYTGKDLAAHLAKGPLSPARVFKVMEQLLGALEAIHSAGVIHRDLKPENVFVMAGGEDEVRLVDFGIARAMDDHLPAGDRLYRSGTGVISGSPAYVAPETIAGSPGDGRTDIYSLGVMFFALLTGRLPLWGESPYDYLREHMVGVPLTLFQGQRERRWHPELESLIAQMLAKDLEQRPASCAQILARLRGGLRAAALAELDLGPPEVQASDPNASVFNRFFRRSWF